MIRLVAPEIGEREIKVVTKVLRSGFLGQNKYVQEFEEMVAHSVGVRHAVAVSSGTAALHLSLLALGIGRGDEVILPDFTFPATANVVKLVGAQPIFVDIDLATFNIDPVAMESAITPRTKAVIPVHLFGQPADMRPILKSARQHRLFVVEDAACSLGAEYHGKRCGSLGDVGCFSFHPRKIITTGEGGMVVTNRAKVAEKARSLRNHGMKKTNGGHPCFNAYGLNYRMTDFQAALGVSQMRRIEEIVTYRVRLAQSYQRALSGIDSIVLPSNVKDVRHVWQSYVILVKKRLHRDKLLECLRRNGIESTIGTYALSIQPHWGGRKKRFPNSYLAYRQSLCLPLHSRMCSSEIKEVVRCLKKVLCVGW